MVIWMILFAVLSFVVFAKYPSPALILSWLIMGIAILLAMMGWGSADGLMFMSFLLCVLVLSLTAIVTGGNKQ